jgi:hypothetical protein
MLPEYVEELASLVNVVTGLGVEGQRNRLSIRERPRCHLLHHADRILDTEPKPGALTRGLGRADDIN